MNERKQVLIVGGGFAGLSAAQALRGAAVDVTLIDKRNFHLFQPLLYQVATGGLSPADIASPLRGILARQTNVRVIQGRVTNIDPTKHEVLVDGQPIEFDFLLVAAGSRHHYFGNDEWEEDAPGLKTVEDGLKIRRRVLSAFERAEIEEDSVRRQALLSFVVVGGGPTGVELAGALGELAHYTLRNEFRDIDTAEAKILLIEGTDRLLPTFPASLSRQAKRSLEKLGVKVRTNTRVEAVDSKGVTLHSESGTERVSALTVLWGAGVTASPLGRCLAESTGAAVDRRSPAPSDSCGRAPLPSLSSASELRLWTLSTILSTSDSTATFAG